MYVPCREARQRVGGCWLGSSRPCLPVWSAASFVGSLWSSPMPDYLKVYPPDQGVIVCSLLPRVQYLARCRPLTGWWRSSGIYTGHRVSKVVSLPRGSAGVPQKGHGMGRKMAWWIKPLAPSFRTSVQSLIPTWQRELLFAQMALAHTQK